MWAKLPSDYSGERFARLIPFRDHINMHQEILIRSFSKTLNS